MSESSWDETRVAFTDAARWFAAATRMTEGRWDEHALGEWSVRDLVGHTSRAALTVENYLQSTPGVVELRSAAEYFQRALAGLADPAAVAQRGRDAGAALGADPAAAVEAIVDRLVARVDGASADDYVATPVGGMRLADYLPSRTFELTVHTCDLVVAVGGEPDVPERSAAAAFNLIGQLAAVRGLAAPLLLAATGRRGLPGGYSVL